MTILEDLQARGIIKEISDIDKFNNLKKGSKVYIGFDPTAQSLHLGNYAQISILKRFEQYGYEPIAILGGATGMIGDPSFKDAERVLLDSKTIELNKSKIKKQLEFFGLRVLDNYDWYKDMSIIDFLREVGKSINISYLLAKDSIKSRLERGLSYTEFTYSLLQGWDFLELYKNENVRLQIGGSDQWGNVTTGLEMITKHIGNDHEACAITTNLLTDENGNKIGKSVGGGSLWIDKTMTSAFSMYQYLLNSTDASVETTIKRFTFLTLDEIESLMNKQKADPRSRIAQKTLAYEVVKDLHGEKEAQKAIQITRALFENNDELLSLNSKDIEQLKGSVQFNLVDKSTSLEDALVQSKIVKSKRELNEFIEKGAILVNNQVISDAKSNIDWTQFGNKFAIVRRGKRNYYILESK